MHHSIRSTAPHWIQALADLLLPRRCAACGRILLRGERDLCLNCREDLPLTFSAGRLVNPLSERYNLCIGYRLEPGTAVPFQQAAALFYYGASGHRHLLHRLKFEGNLPLGRRLGTLLGRTLAASALWQDVTVVVPVPLHPYRRFIRGYNQAEVIAREVARELGVPMDTHILHRRRYSTSQVRLETQEKARNVQGAFEADPRRSPDFSLHAAHVLLIDDVCTTGSTLCECFRALSAVTGPSGRISAAVLAMAPEGGESRAPEVSSRE